MVGQNRRLGMAILNPPNPTPTPALPLQGGGEEGDGVGEGEGPLLLREERF